MAYPLRQRQPTQEIAEIVRQGEQLQAHLIVHEVVTGEPRPLQGVFAFFVQRRCDKEANPILRNTPPVIMCEFTKDLR